MGERSSAFKAVVSLIFLTVFGALDNLHASQSTNSRNFAQRNPTKQQIALGLFDNAKGVPIVELIESAETSIDIEIYEMNDPTVIAALRAALKRGVQIRIVKEPIPVGASCHVFDRTSTQQSVNQNRPGAATCEDQQQLVEDVNNAGGTYVAFTKPELCGGDQRKSCLEHGKALIVDEEIALLSTGNFNISNLCNLKFSPKTCNRDLSFVTTDKNVVKTLVKVIDNDIIGKTYDVESVMQGDATDKLTIGPNSLAPIVNFINTARSSILLANQYLKDPTMNEALMRASRRGVEVKITLSSACSFGEPKPAEKKKLTDLFTSFEKSGIEIQMFTRHIRINGKNGYMHSKAIIVDNKKAWIGSVNGSTQATTLNREFGIFFEDTKNLQMLSTILTKDFKDPKGETWQDSLACAENN